MYEVVKKEIKDILEESKNIKPEIIAQEILQWLINNVENYVDNETKLYKIDLIVDSDEMPMTKKLQDLYMAIPDDEEKPCEKLDKSSSQYQDEIRAWEESIKESSDCRRELDKIVEEAHGKMKGDEETLNKLFKRLIFFYEKIIMNPENKQRAFDIDIELKSLIEGKEKASEEEKKKIQERIVELIKEGEELVQWEEFNGSASIMKFDYEAFSVGVKLTSKPTDEEQEKGTEEEVLKEYTIPEGFVVWLELVYKLKQRPTVMF
jgi:hypothetical protein